MRISQNGVSVLFDDPFGILIRYPDSDGVGVRVHADARFFDQIGIEDNLDCGLGVIEDAKVSDFAPREPEIAAEALCRGESKSGGSDLFCKQFEICGLLAAEDNKEVSFSFCIAQK